MRYLNYKELGIVSKIDLVTFIMGLISCLFLLYVNFISKLQPHAERGLIIGAALLIVFLRYPFTKTNPLLRWTVDMGLITITVLCYGYIVLTAHELVYRLGNPSTSDLLVYLPGTLLCLEAVRRSGGPALSIVGACFIAYAHFGHYLPGFFSHGYLDFSRVADALFLSIDGVFGSTTHTMISMIWFFLIFGIFLQLTGAGEAFIDVAYRLAGHRRGGPAQTALISSLLFGTISGSGVANVATTGAFTIPLMKGVGYPPHFAGAAEAAASMGGQITPPVLGSTAFLIAGLTGITYLTICKFSIIPCILYFFCIFLCIYFEAGRLGLSPIPRDQIPRIDRDLLLRITVPLFSIGTIIVILLSGFTPRMSATGAVLFLVIVASIYNILFKKMRMSPAVVLKGLAEGFNTGASLAAILATAGACVGVIYVTGIGMKFSALVVSLGQAHLIYAITMVMLASILIGMGLPTPACYLILAILAAPAMIKLGAPVLETHFLIFYYAVFAGLTPPVGIAFMTAATIAGANPLKTGIMSVRLAIVGLIMPYVWMYCPAIVLKGSIVEILWAFFTTVVGVIGLAMANIGYSINKKLHIWERVLLLLISIPLIFFAKGILVILILIFGLLFYVHHYGLTFEPIQRLLTRGEKKA